MVYTLLERIVSLNGTTRLFMSPLIGIGFRGLLRCTPRIARVYHIVKVRTCN
jgi:hypothetical protein